ncbi:hypothetical protein A2U01_0097779, partial [Trifolium medium]|nr:hypothetical protein [Trifolium medium]
ESGYSSVAGAVREDGGARRRRKQSWRVTTRKYAFCDTSIATI